MIGASQSAILEGQNSDSLTALRDHVLDVPSRMIYPMEINALSA
jgi:hypothetical protein